MILTGVLALVVGAVLAFAVPGHVGDVGVSTLGAVVMVAGAVILVMGLLRLRRGARARRSAGSAARSWPATRSGCTGRARARSSR
jgi:hypothetical protein